jgi:hypothetical protein
VVNGNIGITVILLCDNVLKVGHELCHEFIIIMKS